MEEVEKVVHLGATVTTTSGVCQAGKSTSSLLQLKEHLEEQSTQHKHQVEDF